MKRQQHRLDDDAAWCNSDVVPLTPRHPYEPALHKQLRDALNEGLTNTNFFVLIDVEPTGEAPVLSSTDAIVADTDAWLESIDPDAIVTGTILPALAFTDPGAKILVRAIPKKTEARDGRAQEIVANPEPILAGFV